MMNSKSGSTKKTKSATLFKAHPVRSNENGTGEILGAVYIEASIEDVSKQAQAINRIFISATGIAMVLTFLVVTLLARTITMPILDMRRQALRMSHGDFRGKSVSTVPMI